jgi:2-dehydropantoate 2-reductase
MEVVIHGAGSLGSLVGALLARVHDVTLVGRDPHVSTIEAEGLAVFGVDDFEVTPAARTTATGLSGDLAVVTVKAFDTGAAGRDLASDGFDAVLSLQNGMGNEETLAAHLDCPVLAGTTTLGAVRREPGVVEWTGGGEVVLGPWSTTGMDGARRVGVGFREAGIPTTVDPEMAGRLWEKLAVNTAINPVTALARIENGGLFGGPAGSIARTAARETARVARAEGVDLADDRAESRAREVAAATADNRSSMYQDVLARRRTEVDAIPGYVVSRAERHRVSVPVTRSLASLVKAWEAGAGLR